MLVIWGRSLFILKECSKQVEVLGMLVSLHTYVFPGVFSQDLCKFFDLGIDIILLTMTI